MWASETVSNRDSQTTNPLVRSILTKRHILAVSVPFRADSSGKILIEKDRPAVQF
jgi:hypothetical protein